MIRFIIAFASPCISRSTSHASDACSRRKLNTLRLVNALASPDMVGLGFGELASAMLQISSTRLPSPSSLSAAPPPELLSRWQRPGHTGTWVGGTNGRANASLVPPCDPTMEAAAVAAATSSSDLFPVARRNGGIMSFMSMDRVSVNARHMVRKRQRS